MRDSLTEIICIFDMSGSMHSLASEVVGGFNSFIEEQRKLPGEAKITVVFFDSNTYLKWQDGTPLQDCPVLTRDTYRPSACTPLLDAVGRTVNEVGQRLANTDEAERPGKILVLIVTDGYENASREFSRQQIRDMVKHQEETYSWTFTYLGANVDAFAEAQTMGISPHNTAGYTGSVRGIRAAFRTYNSSAGNFRRVGQIQNLGRNIAETEADAKS